MEICETVEIVGMHGAFADEAAFDTWVRQTQKPLVRFCRQFVGGWAEAEDMAQQAYLKAWEKRVSFRGKSSLLTWQMAIARRVCLDFIRRRKTVELVSLEDGEVARRSEFTNRSSDTCADVRQTLSELNADDRAILYLRVGEEMPFGEVARVLHCTPAAARKRYERAKVRFETIYSGKE